jgi:hypothetical protein
VEEKEIQDELTSIRSLMERSSKFISLSGLSGVLAGIYALIGAAMAYYILYYEDVFSINRTGLPDLVPDVSSITGRLMIIAIVVLLLSVTTGFLLTQRKAKKKGQSVWGNTSRQLLFNMAVPLFTGGALMLVLINRGYFGVVASASLIFYGLALVNASIFTFKDVRYLGFCDIFLGLLAGLFPGYGLFFWAFGFGVLHIVYGSIMYIKYDR